MTERAFTTRIAIRFSDEDHARIVYYPRYFHFFHMAFEDFFAANGRAYRDVLDVDGYGWPAVHSEADFLGPLRMGDVLELSMHVEKIGSTSVAFRYQGREATSGRDVVRGATTVVCVKLETMEKIEIPAQFRDIFTRYVQATG